MERQQAMETFDKKNSGKRILAVVDDSERTGPVVEFLLGLAASGLQMSVVVVNIQPAPEDWRLRGYQSFKADEIQDRLINDLGTPVVRNVARRLDEAKIPHKQIVNVGAFADSIQRLQREEGCDWIVASEATLPSARLWLMKVFGLGATRVSVLAQTVEVPVTIVK
jgi:nucleotide-binding universal stress UspA family protein